MYADTTVPNIVPSTGCAFSLVDPGYLLQPHFPSMAQTPYFLKATTSNFFRKEQEHFKTRTTSFAIYYRTSDTAFVIEQSLMCKTLKSIQE